MKFFEELKRRNVIKATMAYVVVAWVLIQVFTNILPAFQAPPWVLQVLMILLAIGLPVWIIFSWVYDVTPEGLKKTEDLPYDPNATATTNKRLNVLILAALVIAIGLHFLDRPEASSKETVTDAETGLSLRENSIAVLPFLDMSPNKDQEYYSDGIAVEILNALCKYRELKVVGRTSSFSFKNKDEDILSIGRQLKVNNILEGSVQKQEDKVRISVQLTDAQNGYTLFSETYTDSLQNIFALQSRIAGDIAKRIEGELALNEKEVPVRQKTDPKAYELTLRGKLEFVYGPLNMTPKEVKRAKRYFEKAIELDPDYAEANSYLSLVYFNLTDWVAEEDARQRKIYLDSARTLAHKAHELDSLSPGAHLAMGSAYFHDYDWVNAEKEKRRAVGLNPGGADEKFTLSSFLSQFGHPEEAIELSKEALKSSPLDVEAELNYVKVLNFSGQLDQCIDACNKLIEANPDLPGAYQFLFVSLADLGRFEEGRKAFAELLRLTGQMEESRLFLENDFKTAAEKSLALNETRQLNYLNRPIFQASFYAYLKDRENTIKYLNKVYDNRDPQISWMRWRRFDFLRDDPRFQQLYEKAGLQAYDDYRKSH